MRVRCALFCVAAATAATVGLTGLGVGAAPAPAERVDLAVHEVVERTAHDRLFDVEFVEEEGWAVGDYGLVLHTSDAGAHWDEQATPSERALLGVDFADADRGVAVGQGGTVLVTEQGGRLWEPAPSGVESRLFSVAVGGDGLAFAVGEFGAVLRSRNFGRSWEELSPDWKGLLDRPETPHLYEVRFRTEDEVVLAGEFGLLLRSRDAGSTWQAARTGEASLFSLHFVDGRVGTAVGQRGTVLRTEDGGESWSRVPVPTDANLLDVWLSAHDEGVITGVRTLLRSRDGGRSWRIEAPDPISTRWYQAIGLAAGFTESEPIRDESGREIGGAARVYQERVYVVGMHGSILRLGN